MSYRYCVVVPFHRNSISPGDIGEIGGRIAQRDETVLWKPIEIKQSVAPADFRPPTIPAILLEFHTIKPRSLPQFEGPRLSSKPFHKATQLKMLGEAGIPVPPWTRLEPHTAIYSGEFGPFVLIKSTERDSSLGRGISLIRTADFESYRDTHAAQYKGIGRSAPIVQKFIKTGGNARHYRVITFMGRVIHSAVLENAAPIPLNMPATQLLLSQRDVTSNAGVERRGWLFEDQEMFDMARKVARVFDTPVLGIDLIRCAETQDVFVLEANAGNVWLFSSVLGRAARKRLGRDAIREQHNVFSVVADAIIERVNQELAPKDEMSPA